MWMTDRKTPSLWILAIGAVTLTQIPGNRGTGTLPSAWQQSPVCARNGGAGTEVARPAAVCSPGRANPLSSSSVNPTERQERLELRKSPACQRVFTAKELKVLSESPAPFLNHNS